MSVVDEKVAAGAGAAGAGAAEIPANWEPKIVAFCCHWCTYTGADLAGLNRMNYPPNVRVLRIPCSGRMNPQFVIEALNKGCDGVLVCGCHPGDCHYSTGNYFARRRMMIFKRLMEYEGLEPNRLQVRWISGAEAAKFRDTVTEVTEQVRALGPLHPVQSVGAAETGAADGGAAGAGAAGSAGAAASASTATSANPTSAEGVE